MASDWANNDAGNRLFQIKMPQDRPLERHSSRGADYLTDVLGSISLLRHRTHNSEWPLRQ